MKVNKRMFDSQGCPVYSAPEVQVILTCDGAGICEESRFNSTDDTEYFKDGESFDLGDD